MYMIKYIDSIDINPAERTYTSTSHSAVQFMPETEPQKHFVSFVSVLLSYTFFIVFYIIYYAVNHMNIQNIYTNTL